MNTQKDQVRIGVWENELLKEDKSISRVWRFFRDLCVIPRKSGEEKKAIEYVLQFARDRNLKYETDSEGNVLFFCPATEGIKNAPGIVFQSHLDMVSQGEPDPSVYGVVPFLYSDNDQKKWVTADGTTLGADNGIGVALMLAIVDENIPHGPLAFLLTNREETGLESAMGVSLQSDLKQFSYLFNLDSEKEGKATISCAGAGDSIIEFSGKRNACQGKKILEITLTGLMGGHSGVVIHEKRLNAVKVMVKALRILEEKIGRRINVISFDGGTAKNAIPKEVKVRIAITLAMKEQIESLLPSIRKIVLKDSINDEEKELKLTVDVIAECVGSMLDDYSTSQFLCMIEQLPDGLIKLSQEIEGFPETSSNIGIVKTSKDGMIRTEIMSRSSKPSSLEDTRKILKEVAIRSGAAIHMLPAYSGWAPVLNSEINSITVDAWKKVSRQKMDFEYTHAGLECGVLLGHYPHLQAISIGPEIVGAHTTEERVSVESVEKDFDLLKALIMLVAKQNKKTTN